MTVPRCASGTSTQICSNGSFRLPSISLYKTVGRDTSTSKPSRRIVSSSTAICMLPRASTRKRVLSLVSCTLMEMLDLVSRSSRARISREVTFLPSSPASGPSFTENSICTVAGSISTNGSGSASSALASVSPMSTSSNPASPAISPAVALITSVVCRPENCFSLMIFTLCRLPLRPITLTMSPCWTSPDKIRPMAMRPT